MDITLSHIEVRVPGRNTPLFSIASLTIPAGARILIHGPSGRGKTTLLHLLAGQFRPERGSVTFVPLQDGGGEEEICRLRHHRFGIVFQRLNLIDHLTARENVLLGLTPPAPRARADEALMALGLDRQADQIAATLSPGEQQRTAVARVLAAQPEVILADEPTSSLDQANAEAVMAALVKAALGKTLVVVSHDQRIRGFFETVWDFADLVTA